MQTVRRAIIAGLAVMLAALPAQANKGSGGTDRNNRDIVGSWSFQTKPYREGSCSMTGTMVLAPQEAQDTYDCELIAIETCTMWGRSVVRQSCQARRFGNQLSVRSTIEEMIETKTEGLVYVPDNFTLTIQSPSRMFGALVSAVTAPVEFRRATEGVS